MAERRNRTGTTEPQSPSVLIAVLLHAERRLIAQPRASGFLSCVIVAATDR